MLKKSITLFLIFCFLITGMINVTATGYQLTEDITSASSDALLTDGAMRSAGDTTSDYPDNALPGNGSSDNSTDDSPTTIEENRSKYNGMATDPVSEVPGLSRYSTGPVRLSPDISGTKYEEAAELLGALGIMVGDAENGAFRPNDNIIRSEMAKVAVYSVGLEDIALNSNGATPFPDVPSDHWATGAINVAHQQDMVIGDSEGTFRPDDPVTLQEAVTIIVRAMGYEPAAADRGGYPAGYLYIASSNQLLRGIDGVTSAPATRGDVAQLIFNSLTVNLMEQVGYGSEVSYEVVDKTLLYDKLNVEKGYGQITGTGETTLTGGNTTAEDRIQIDDKIFLEGESKARNYLGYNVLYYARVDRKTDEKTLINVRQQTNKNRSITVNANDIVSVTGAEGENRDLEYWGSNTDRNTKTAQISKDASYIYNGKYKTGVTLEQMQPESGNIILLDSDTNNIYDIVFVNHFTNIVVDTVSEITGRVTDKYLNGSLVFDPDDNDVMYTLTRDGEDISITDLREWNVISYTISEDRQLIKAYVSTASVNGTITEVTDRGYRIGSSEDLYEVAPSYPNTIELRDRGTFYLDIEGNIAAVDENATIDAERNEKYAYLVDAMMNDGFETTGQLKIFTSSGATSVLTTTERLRFNDRYSVQASDVIDALKPSGSVASQLIVYETNSAGEITAIETAADGTGTGAPNTGRFTLNIQRENMVYKSASQKLGNVGIDENTIIFDIPAGADKDTTKYSIRTRDSLSNDTAYNAYIYDLQENYVANVVIITSGSGTAAAESPIMIVDYISETQNEDGETTDRLYGWQSGAQRNLLAYDRSILVKTAESSQVPLERGDIIQYRTNASGEIDSITLLFNSRNKETEFINEISEDFTCVYGRVTRKFSGSVNVSINGDIRNYATGDATVYLYDSSRNTNNIQVVSAADIEIYEEGNEARLFIRIYEDQVTEMVIVR